MGYFCAHIMGGCGQKKSPISVHIFNRPYRRSVYDQTFSIYAKKKCFFFKGETKLPGNRRQQEATGGICNLIILFLFIFPAFLFSVPASVDGRRGVGTFQLLCPQVVVRLLGPWQAGPSFCGLPNQKTPSLSSGSYVPKGIVCSYRKYQSRLPLQTQWPV